MSEPGLLLGHLVHSPLVFSMENKESVTAGRGPAWLWRQAEETGGPDATEDQLQHRHFALGQSN